MPKPVGTIFAELALDTTSYTKSQREILASASQTALNVEKNWKIIGEKSDVMYDAMRQRIENAYQRIAHSATASQQEIVRAQQAAANKIKQIDAQQYGAHVSMLDKMKQNWVVMTAAVTAAYLAASKAFDLVDKAAAYAENLETLNFLSSQYNITGQQMVKTINENSGGLIGLAHAAKVSADAIAKGFTPEQLSQMAKWAPVIDDFSSAVGSSNEAFELLVQTMAAGRERGTVQLLGATIDLKTAFGEQAENMSKAEKAMAIYNLVAQRMTEIQKTGVGTTDSLSDSIERFKNQVEELKLTLGDILIRMGAGLMATFQSVAALALWLARVVMAPISALMLATDYLGITKGKAEEYKIAMEAMAAAGEDLAVKAAANFELMKKGMQSGTTLAKGGGSLGFGDAAASVNKELDNLNKSILEQVRKSSADIAGLGMILFDKEMERIKSQADAWRKLGADRVAVEKWVVNETILARAKQDEEIKRMEREVADAISAIRERVMKNALADIADRAAAELHAINAAEKAFEQEIDFYSQLAGFEDTYYSKKLEWIEKEMAAKEELYGLDAASAWRNQEIAKTAAEKWDMEHKGAMSMISDTQKAFDSASSLFAKESKEYKAMQAFKQAAFVAEMAMNVSKAASALTVALAQNAANASVATTGAAASVAAQGSVPIAGFGLAAAMAAFMASVLAASGIAWGGGSAGGASAPVLPASTVLGAEAGTGSDSISKVWELLEDTYDLEYRELTGIHNSMKDLNRNITGLVSAFLRGGSGFEEGEFNLGFSPGAVEKMTSKYISAYTKIFTLGLLDSLPGMNWLSSAAGKVFGGGKTTSLQEAGIEFKAQSVGDLVAGEYMDAVEYAIIKTVKKGGWFKKDKTSYSTIYETLDEDVSRLFTLVFQNMSTTLVELAKGLGADVNAVIVYEFEGAKLDLKGKTGEEINKTLSEYFSKVGDVAVRALFGDLVAQYQQLNEGLFETAARLVIDKAIVTEILTMTNQGLPGTTAQIIAFSESLIAMAGGLDVLQEASATYYDKFFTDAEKQARLQGQLSGAFGDLGMTLPGSRSGYRALVEGLDLTTEAGKEAYVALLKWSQAADDYYSAMGDNLDMQNNLTASLEKQSETIARWLQDLNVGSLAPVMSAQAQEAAYARAREAAFAPGAAEADTNAFLTAASEYLKFSRSYSGDYAGVYQMVTEDVQRLADAIALALTQTTLPVHGSGGLTRGPTITGEIGREWNVPTYEPQRSRFLESAPPQFWENLRGAGVVQSGGGGDITIRLVNVIDGKVLSDSVAKHIPRNANLSEAIKRVN